MTQENLKHKINNKKIFKKLSLWMRPFQREKGRYLQKINTFLASQMQNDLSNDDFISADQTEAFSNKESLHNHAERISTVSRKELNQCIEKSKDFLISLRENDQYWNARLDSNSGLNAQYILFKFSLGLKKDPVKDQKIINYILNTQQKDGSWNIYYKGEGHLSYSITCYFALKLYGYSTKDPLMRKARRFIISEGGIMKANVETRFWLALLDQYNWEGLPPIPVQILLAPNSFAFSIYNISYWSRTSLVSMSVIYHKKLVIKPPKEAYIDELYAEPVDKNRIRFAGEPPKLISLENILLQMTKAAKLLEKASPEILDKIAIRKAKDWILHHQDDEGDWGGIYPAMQYSIMALYILGYSIGSPEIKKGLAALERFQIETDKNIMLSACTSPVWDTAWAIYALNTLNYPMEDPVIQKATKWLYDQQIFRDGDWAIRNPNVLPGGWCFQFYNDFYPDTDDTAVVLMALLSTLSEEKNHDPFKLGLLWLISMQNNDGGWGAFERNVNKEIINYFPLNDINNFLDQSTADVTGRVLELLGQIGFTMKDPVVHRAVHFIRQDQEDFGAWFGRWGVNYIYGTWSVLKGLKNINEDMTSPYIQKAVHWLKSVQNHDGGWGESCLSYTDIKNAGVGISTASQTAWALLALLSADEINSPEVEKGMNYLIQTQNNKGGWDEKEYTGTGFEKAFYLRYYYYPYYFPLLALGNYCQIKSKA